MRKALLLMIIIILFPLTLAICLRKELPSAVILPPQLSPTPRVARKTVWQQDWEILLSATRQEGKVVVITGVGPEVRNALATAFREATGIEIEFIVGRAPELAEKISTERRAG